MAVPAAVGHLRRLRATSLRRALAGQTALIQRGMAVSLGREAAEKVGEDEDGQEQLWRFSLGGKEGIGRPLAAWHGALSSLVKHPWMSP